MAVQSYIRISIESIWNLKVRKLYLDRVDREERNWSQKRARGGPSLAELCGPRKDCCNLEVVNKCWWNWLCRRLAGWRCGSEDVGAEIRFLQRLMQFGKFINTGEIGYNLCLQQLSIVDDAAPYQARRLRTPLCFCVPVQSYIRISVNTNLEQQSPHIKPDWIDGRQGEAPQKESCDPFFFVLLVSLSLRL